jgi:acetyl-CoA synthetase
LELERRLEELLGRDRFPPPQSFITDGSFPDASAHADAERDPDGFWAEEALRLHWDAPFSTVLDDSDPPFHKWFSDGKLNVSYNCLDRHVAADRGHCIAFHWAGEESEERAVTYAELLSDVRRMASALKQLGVHKGDVVGIYLPMLPEVVVASSPVPGLVPRTMSYLAALRRRPSRNAWKSRTRRFSSPSMARGARQNGTCQAPVDQTMADLRSLEHIIVVRHTGIDVPMRDGRDLFYDEITSTADPVCPPEPMEVDEHS